MSTTEDFEDYRIAIDEQLDLDPAPSSNVPNATKFHYFEAPIGYREGGRRESYQDWYKRLSGYQTGFYNGWWEDAKKHNNLSKLQLLEAIASHLELTSNQQLEAKRLLKTVVSDMRRYGAFNAPVTETVVIALCAYICTKDGRQCHPDHEEYDELFENMKITVGVQQWHYERVYGRLEQDILKAEAKRGI